MLFKICLFKKNEANAEKSAFILKLDNLKHESKKKRKCIICPKPFIQMVYIKKLQT